MPEVHVHQNSNSLEAVLAKLERIIMCKEEAYSLLVYLILGKLYQLVVSECASDTPLPNPKPFQFYGNISSATLDFRSCSPFFDTKYQMCRNVLKIR